MTGKFSIITSVAIKKIIKSQSHSIYEMVKLAYIKQGEGIAKNPSSYFLTFPDKPKSRIIALPALISQNPRIAGIKWISSNPDNLSNNLKRASAVIILNDYDTGYPIACIEGSIISALRTVYSAIIVGEYLSDIKHSKRVIGIIGTGNISKHFVESIITERWKIDQIVLYDSNYKAAVKLKDEIQNLNRNIKIDIQDDLNTLIINSEMIFLSTTSQEPYIRDFLLFKSNTIVLHISLRDLAPEILTASNNIVDDVDHVLNANTSPHLVYEKTGNKNFINCTVYELINGYNNFDIKKPIIFSPMGMGILDLMVANYLYEEAQRQNLNIEINNFFQ